VAALHSCFEQIKERVMSPDTRRWGARVVHCSQQRPVKLCYEGSELLHALC
jgi:hypothetical protein